MLPDYIYVIITYVYTFAVYVCIFTYIYSIKFKTVNKYKEVGK